MSFLYFLEKIRNPVFDVFFSGVTYLGGEGVFLVVAILLLWCADKREGYYVLFTCYFGAAVNQFLKLLCRVPRPWVRDPDFTIVESARAGATGYSFPSGHTQNAVGMFGAYAAAKRQRRVFIVSAVLIFLVGLSRMYLGVHTPADVLTSLGVGLLLTAALYPLFRSEESFRRCAPWLFFGAALLSVGFMLFAFLFPDGVADETNLASARKTACTLLGAVLGLVPAYFLDRFRLRYPTHGRIYAQVLKVAGGLAVVLLIQNGLRTPLLWLFGGREYVARTVRYFLLAAFAGMVWPLTFRYFSNLRLAAFDRWLTKHGFLKETETESEV